MALGMRCHLADASICRHGLVPSCSGREGWQKPHTTPYFCHRPAPNLLGFVPHLSMYLAPFQAPACHASARALTDSSPSSWCWGLHAASCMAHWLLKPLPVSCAGLDRGLWRCASWESPLLAVHSRTPILANPVCNCNSPLCRRRDRP